MRRTTVLLTVTLLAGTPALSLACEIWCSTPMAETHHTSIGCHRTSAESTASEHVIAAATECHEVPAITALLQKSWQSDTRSAPPIAAVHDSPALLAHRNVSHEGWPVFNGQVRRTSSLRAILRI